MKLDIVNQDMPDMKATINTFGAYVETFTKANEPIFFPKVLTKIGKDLKQRGGMHPCLPNFSNDEIFGLPQHGFGRDVGWDVLSSGKDYVDLKYCGEDIYKDVYFYINYRLEENKFITSLKVYNRSDKEVYLGPGFHPYFYCKDLDVSIDNFTLDKDKLDDTIFLKSDKVKFRANGKDYFISGDNVGLYAIWTDLKGDYVCIEPTYKGKVFAEDKKDIYKLCKDKEFSQEFVIEIL
ncbi:MAG: aldose epimerase [Peptoniphilaceae bacterium]|nr:aldose epimerase [Peptoniphilaceae bacterium]MDY6019450.1 aldose epimerase [Anaerococcus sp.]